MTVASKGGAFTLNRLTRETVIGERPGLISRPQSQQEVGEMSCECVESVNELLVSRNTRLAQALMFGECKHPGLMLQTEQIEKGRGKAKAVSMFLTFCPFCGVKYGEP